MPTTPTTCPLDCADACGALVESDARGAFVALRGNPAHGWSRGTLCGKTAIYGDLVTSPDRLTRPLVRAGGALRPATWAAALDRIAERVAELPGERVLALEYAGNMGLLARRTPVRVMNALGATRHDGGICDASATVGWELVLGRVTGPDIEAVEESDALVLWGCDAARTVQHLVPAVKRMARRGVPVVVIDVWRTETMRTVERLGGRGLVLRGGTDAALALALCRAAYERGRADRAFLDRECVGAERFEEHARSGHDLAWAARTTGLEPAEIEALWAVLSEARAPFLKVGVGWTRRRNGGASMRAVASLAAVLGHADRIHFQSGDWFGLAVDALERPDLRPAGAPTRRVPQVALGPALAAGDYGAVFVWGHNPAVTLPDARRVRAGLSRSDVFLVVHEAFRTETAELADVVLPAKLFLETEDVFQSYGHRRLQWARPACRAPGEARSNVEAFAAIGRRLGLPRAAWDVTEASLCAELLERSADRLAPAELAALRAGEPVKLAPRGLAGWGTPSGKVELASARAEALGRPAMATFVEDDGAGDAGAFRLIPAPSRATHNSTYAHSPRHLLRAGPPTAWLHPADARALGVADGDRVRLSNARGALTLRAGATDDQPRGTVRVDGLPRAADVPEGVGLNALTSPMPAELGDGNVIYSARVDVERVAGPG